MKAYSRVKAAQTRAKKTIEEQQKLGWNVSERTLQRVNMEVPRNISAKKAQAIIDNLSKQTIKLTRTKSRDILTYESDPIVTGHYKSGAKQFKTSGMPTPKEIKTRETFSESSALNSLLNEIDFVMKNAPSPTIAKSIVKDLGTLKHLGLDMFKEGKNAETDVLGSLKSRQQILKSIKGMDERKRSFIADKFISVYKDLTAEYGKNERGLAGRQVGIYQNMLSNIGTSYSFFNPKSSATIQRVVDFMIDNSKVWNKYRDEFRLRAKFGGAPDSNGVFSTITDFVMDDEERTMDILNYSLDLMEKDTPPSQLEDEIGKRIAYWNDLEDAFGG